MFLFSALLPGLTTDYLPFQALVPRPGEAPKAEGVKGRTVEQLQLVCFEALSHFSVTNVVT